MLTWQIDRIFRAGPLCAVATFALPAALAVLVSSFSDVENVLGIVLVASGLIFIGSIAGSAWTSGLGAGLFGLGTIVAEVSVVLMVVVGAGLFITLIVHDLAGAFHRGPRINPRIWQDAALTATAVVVVGAAVFAVTYGVGRITTWQNIVVPFAIAAIGFAAKLAADSHRTAARQLTSKRSSQPAEAASGNDSSN